MSLTTAGIVFVIAGLASIAFNCHRLARGGREREGFLFRLLFWGPKVSIANGVILVCGGVYAIVVGVFAS